MATVIVADENEGRRNLLAGSIEREGYSVTRAATLKQCEGTALATMPDVVLIDGGWKSGDPVDTASRLTSDPEFDLKCRVVIVSADSGSEYLMSAAQAGVSEVLSKPVDMRHLLGQLQKHANKLFVPPPADIDKGAKGGYFDIQVTAGDPSWSLPILEQLLGDEALDDDFLKNIMTQVEGELEGIDNLDSDTLKTILRTTFDALILDATEEHGEGEEAQRMSRLEEALDIQAERIEDAIEAVIDPVLDELPDKVAILTEETGLIPTDPDALNMAVRSLELIQELLWEIGIPGRLADTTLSIRVEEAVILAQDAKEALEGFLPEDEG
ncbi:MAG: response regulator [Candidatus Thalassarchaeaceae archaeon]|jgi:CheY-like chemotaxis protein|nr:response regulator [Candidatus Thalassarchaeaceae archaeon]